MKEYRDKSGYAGYFFVPTSPELKAKGTEPGASVCLQTGFILCGLTAELRRECLNLSLCVGKHTMNIEQRMCPCYIGRVNNKVLK